MSTMPSISGHRDSLLFKRYFDEENQVDAYELKPEVLSDDSCHIYLF